MGKTHALFAVGSQILCNGNVTI